MTDTNANALTMPAAPVLATEKVNGVVKPRPDSAGGYVWQVADFLMSQRMAANETHVIPRGEEVKNVVLSQLPGAKPPAISTYFNRWLRYNSLVDALKARKDAERKGPRSTLKITAENVGTLYSRAKMREAKIKERIDEYAAKLAKLQEKNAALFAKMAKAGFDVTGLTVDPNVDLGGRKKGTKMSGKGGKKAS